PVRRGMGTGREGWGGGRVGRSGEARRRSLAARPAVPGLPAASCGDGPAVQGGVSALQGNRALCHPRNATSTADGGGQGRSPPVRPPRASPLTGTGERVRAGRRLRGRRPPRGAGGGQGDGEPRGRPGQRGGCGPPLPPEGRRS